MNYTNIILELHKNFAIIKLNDPAHLNTIKKQMLLELDNAFQSIENDTNIKALIITGNSDKSFAVGADLNELHQCDTTTGNEYSELGSKVFSHLSRILIPTIAAINGYALGGGLELALACHFRFASLDAKFGQTEINLGVIPAYGGTQRLPRIIGKSRALELLLSGKMISAHEAERMGLVNAVFNHDDLMNRTIEFIELLLSKSPLTIQAIIECVNAYEKMSESDGMRYESKKFAEICGTEDFKEGTHAFLEKRKPVFKGK